MRIWVDADACPNPIKEIVYRAATRTRIEVTLVANQPLRTPRSAYIKTLQVPAGFDVADNRIVALMESGDLVITADIPLAAVVVAQGGAALNPRGELYTDANIRERLAMRNLMETLRGAGAVSGGPPSLNNRDRQVFAGQLDRLLAKSQR
ncbi:MAG TPA: YaiI/YqxD family protein [Gammaproteobacteria bacterium]|nr:YaiI/YqxD family protein [Gammaproteobacteria bacterium]